MAPRMWHSEGSKTLDAIEKPVVGKDEEQKGMNRWSVRIFKEWKCSVWQYNDDYVSLYIYLNP